MVDAWLAMMAELEALLDGKRTFLQAFINKNGKGLNLKILFDDPPEKFVLDPDQPLGILKTLENLPDKYWSKGKEVDYDLMWRALQVFGDPTAVAYAAWFN
jgi:hypothetical protein